MKAAAVIFVLFFLPATQQAQTPGERDLIEWNEYYKLTWNDFQGKGDATAQGDAGAAVSIQAKPYFIRKKVHYNVFAYFNRQKSWASDTADHLLSHEQLHFDIAELYARKIRKKISELNSQGVDDVKTYNAAIHALLEESNLTDQQYDIETLHGMLIKKQHLWQEKVTMELQALSQYGKPRHVIGREKTG